jgi:hypothetical protein
MEEWKEEKDILRPQYPTAKEERLYLGLPEKVNSEPASTQRTFVEHTA